MECFYCKSHNSYTREMLKAETIVILTSFKSYQNTFNYINPRFFFNSGFLLVIEVIQEGLYHKIGFRHQSCKRLQHTGLNIFSVACGQSVE